MADIALVKYIKDSLAAGHQRQDIVTALLAAGWAQSMVDDGFAEVEKPKVAPVVVTPKTTLPQNIPPKAVEAATPASPVASLLDVTTSSSSSRVDAMSSSPGTIIPQKKSNSRIIAVALIVFVLVVLGSGTAYMYFAKIGPFARPPYAENNLVQGILASISRIDTSSYAVSGSFSASARDADAKPLVLSTANNADFVKRYQNDVRRAQDIVSILQNLNSYSYKSSKIIYPSSLQALLNKQQSSYYRLSLTNPINQYMYTTTEQGKNFTLTTEFETDAVIPKLKQTYKYSASTTPIDGRKVTFTKDSYNYIYLPSTPPKPFLVEMSDAAVGLPAEFKMNLAASATTDWRNNDAGWQFNINANGDFGDMTYKLDIDALKKGSAYYFKINNFPSLFSFFIGSIEKTKGQWVKIDTATASSSQADYFDFVSSLASQLPEAEKSYKEQRQEFVDVLKKAASIADEEHLLTLKNPPTSEHIDGRLLYRYDLKVNKNAIAAFYKRLINETIASKFDVPIFADSGYVEYLQSAEFNEIFDYYDKNTSLTLWADPQGFPGIVQYTMRIVPPDTATQLKDKQMNLVLKLVLSNINKPVDIQAPKNAKTIQDLMGNADKDVLGDAKMKSRDARRLADISQLRLALELYYDAKQNYPSRLSDLAPKYIPTIPTDPLDKNAYFYTYHSSGSIRDSYHLGASLEDTNYGLQSDKDCNSKTGSGCGETTGLWNASGAFNGSDDAGCGGEKNRFCYDMTR